MRLRLPQLLRIALLATTLASCMSTITVDVADEPWTTECVGVTSDDCDGIVRMFLNNLARNYSWVREESGASIHVSLSTTCPEFNELARPGECWRVSAPTTSSRACMIMARRIEPLQGYTFVRIGGDELAGLMGAPKPGTTPC